MKHLKHRLATFSFSATSPYCLRVEARRHVEFTRGSELAAPVEKAAAGLVEKAAAAPCAGEGRGRKEAQWRGRKTGCHTWVRWRCQATEQRHDGEGSVVESTIAEAAQRSAVAALR
jgi:hypothetical protein